MEIRAENNRLPCVYPVLSLRSRKANGKHDRGISSFGTNRKDFSDEDEGAFRVEDCQSILSRHL